jgi:TPR repeat protein
MRRVEANDAEAMYVLGGHFQEGQFRLQQNEERAMELWKQAAKLGSSKAHYELGVYYNEGGDSKKAKIHYEAAAMAGHEVARYNLGCMDFHSGNDLRGLKHWTIAASAGHHTAMHSMQMEFEKGLVSRDAIDSTLTAYNTSCMEMRSEARDACIQIIQERV